MKNNNCSSATATQLCPCGLKKPYEVCCGIYIEGNQKPNNPEALMRSRYTAYSQANMDYIARTMKGIAKMRFDVKRASQWAREVEWIKLEVIHSEIQFLKGFVEFMAYFKEQGKINTLHELSEFHYENGEWFYVNGEHRS